MQGADGAGILELRQLATAVGEADEAGEQIRIWVGLRMAEFVSVAWEIDGDGAEPLPSSRGLSRIETSNAQSSTCTGVYDFAVDPASKASAFNVKCVVSLTDGRTVEAEPFFAQRQRRAVPLPDVGEFRLLLVSCYAQHHDREGLIKRVAQTYAGNLAPHLILTVGDQVYLDNPPWESHAVGPGGFEQHFMDAFEQKYWNNFGGCGYASLLRSAPSAAIPDDHEFWNNYPVVPSALSPYLLVSNSDNAWAHCAKALYDGFQLAEQGVRNFTIDVNPLSIHLMDNRTSRSVQGWRRIPQSTLDEAGWESFDAWRRGCLADGAQKIPVLVTGPSIFQPPHRGFGRIKARAADFNFSDFADYPQIMAGITELCRAGLSVLLLTGDVHYPRVLQARVPGVATANPPPFSIVEVISSPASLVGGGTNLTKPSLKSDDLKREGVPKLPYDVVYPTRDPTFRDRPNMLQLGNHVCMLRFTRTMSGVDLAIEYLMIRRSGIQTTPIPGPARNLTFRS